LLQFNLVRVFNVNIKQYDTYYVGFRAFDYSASEPAWVSEGKYIDGEANDTNSVHNIYGEFITLELPSKKFITSYTIIARTYEGSRPSKWYLLGWNSDTGYETIHHQDTALTDTDWVNSSLTKTYSVNPTNNFIKFILVTTHVTAASTDLGFCELYFLGNTNYSGEPHLEIGDQLETKMTYE